MSGCMAPDKKKWWNISPSSGFIHAWEWFILIMVLYNLFSVPYIVSFVATENCGEDNMLRGLLLTLSSACQNGDEYTEVLSTISHPVAIDPDNVEFEFYLPCASSIFWLVNIASDCAFFVDILLSFITGFVPRRSSLPEYNMRSIAVNYMRDTFAFDAIATFPWEPAVRVLFPSASDWLGLKLINLVRFFRLIKVQHKLGAYLSTPWVHLGCIVGVYLMCAHSLASLLFFIGRWQVKDLELGAPNDFVGAPWVINECLQFADSSTQYSVAFYWAVTTITTVGYGDIVPNTNTDKVFVMLAMFFSGTLQAAILANVAVAVESLQAKHTQISTRIRQMMVALKFHDIPSPLTNRVLSSIEYYASQRLQADIACEVTNNVQSGIAIFTGCSPALIREIAMRWTMMITPPSEPVLIAGSPAMEIYHLITGTCAARTSSGIYIGTLAEGSAIGHLDAVLGTTCGADVIAKTYCTMYCLSTVELWEILQPLSNACLGRILVFSRAGGCMRGAGNSYTCSQRWNADMWHDSSPARADHWNVSARPAHEEREMGQTDLCGVRQYVIIPETVQAYPEDARAIKQRALHERSNSHDETVAKLLSARSTLQSGSRQTGDRNVHARAAISAHEATADVDETCELVLLDPMASDIANGPDSLCHGPSAEFSAVGSDTTSAQHNAGGSRVQSSHLLQAQHRLDGMLHRLQDALATLDAMKHNL